MKCELTNHYEKTLAELIQIAYAAAVDSEKWALFVNRASELCGGIGVHLFGHDDVTNSALGVVYGGYDPSYTKSFDEYFGQINSWAPGFFQHEVGAVVHTEQMCPEKELLKTEFYSDWCQPQGDLRTGGGSILYKETSRMFALGGNIQKRNSDRLDRPWLKLVSDLTPHMQQALEISRTFYGMRLEKLALAETSSSHDAAVFVINSSQKVAYANTLGLSMLEERGVVRQSLVGKFDFSLVGISQKFASYLLQHPKKVSPCPLAFSFWDASGVYYVCRAVQHRPQSIGFAPLGAMYSNGAPYYLITLSRPLENKQLKQQLNSCFDVTNAEAQVLLAIADGGTVNTIATGSKKSVHTVRNQLKRAMAKLGVSRQAELALYIERLKNNPFQ